MTHTLQFWPFLPVCWHAINWSRNVGLIFNHSWKNKVLRKRKVSLLVCTLLWPADSLMRFFFCKPPPNGLSFLLSPGYMFVCVCERAREQICFMYIKQEKTVRNNRTFTARRGGGMWVWLSIETLSTFLWFALPVSAQVVFNWAVSYKNVLEEQGWVYVIILFLIEASEMFLALTSEDLFSAQSDEGWWRSPYYFFLVVRCYSVLTS